MRRSSLGFLAATAMLIAMPSGASAATTIGQLAPDPSSVDCSGTFDRTQPTVTFGNTYVVPGTGTITSWSHNARAGAGQTLTMKIYRPLGGATYQVVGHDGPRSLTESAINTFSTSIPVMPGDVLGLSNTPTPVTACLFAVTGDRISFRAGNLADGQSGTFTSNPGSDRRVNVTAVFEPAPGTPPLTCKGKTPTILGTDGPDDIVGTDERDVIAALDGNDKVRGLGGKDLICGGKNKDTLKGGKGKDKLLGQKGRDRLKGGGGRDFCKGGKGDDSASACETERSI